MKEKTFEEKIKANNEIKLKAEKKVIEFGTDLYEYFYAKEWPSLGSHIPENSSRHGVTGPAVVISGQVYDRLCDKPNDGVSRAIFLHEFGHLAWYQKHNDYKKEGRGFVGYTLQEIKANAMALEKIIKYEKEPWYEEALNYLFDEIKSDIESICNLEKKSKEDFFGELSKKEFSNEISLIVAEFQKSRLVGDLINKLKIKLKEIRSVE